MRIRGVPGKNLGCDLRASNVVDLAIPTISQKPKVEGGMMEELLDPPVA